MSYILDALRRAEAERERGAVPGLQSQQHSLEGEDEAPERSRVLVWAVIALAFALIATLAWTLLGGPSGPARQIAEGPVTLAPTPTATAAPAPQSLAEIAAAPPPMAAPAPTTIAAPPQATTLPVPARPSVQTQASTQIQMPSTPPTPRPVIAATPKPAAVAPAVALAAPKTPTATPTAAAASEPRIYAQSELPADIQRELPRVAINGSSYSGDAASRMVMINGQVFHEGDQLSAGLVLDKIRRRSAVLAYKGFRYEVMF